MQPLHWLPLHRPSDGRPAAGGASQARSHLPAVRASLPGPGRSCIAPASGSGVPRPASQESHVRPWPALTAGPGGKVRVRCVKPVRTTECRNRRWSVPEAGSWTWMSREERGSCGATRSKSPAFQERRRIHFGAAPPETRQEPSFRRATSQPTSCGEIRLQRNAARAIDLDAVVTRLRARQRRLRGARRGRLEAHARPGSRSRMAPSCACQAARSGSPSATAAHNWSMSASSMMNGGIR